MNKLRSLANNWMCGVEETNRRNILSMLDKNPDAKVLDLGCDDGSWSIELGKEIGSNNIYGVEVVESRAKDAMDKGVVIKGFDLNGEFDFEDNFFDVVHSNQVIEHLHDTDNFISEIYRILKPGGYIIVSTVNLASWHNVFSLILGFQPFDVTNISIKGSVGNPVSIWRGVDSGFNKHKSWQHVRMFTLRALKEFLELYEFKDIKSKSAGYYPLPNFFANIDKNHGHYIVVKAYK
jgi:SAM-dependent methyltransferase